ncbi:MAG TPA: Rieske (2Fe-2S) protein, partial [Bacteroidales bacterium]|nr:Rieske (2Fe-2S) protein [Bacteroidales bacterium]
AMNGENKEGKQINRRDFLVKSLWGLGGVTGILLSIPVIGALLEPLFRESPVAWRRVGKVDDFRIGDTVLVHFRDASVLPWTGTTSQTASWLRRVSGDQFIAFSVNCAHLGCPLQWVANARIFLCPCHGGVYNEDGSYAAGPPPHDMSRYPVRIEDGWVEIKASPVPITNL